jgi:hypothetical protein
MVPRAVWAVGGGIAAALLYLSVLSGVPGAVLLAYLAQLPLCAVGLSLGTASAMLAGAVGGLVILMTAGIIGTGLFLGVDALPVILISRLALLSRSGDGREWYPVGHLLLWLAGLGLLVFLAAVVAFSDAPGGLQGVVGQFLQSSLGRMMSEPLGDGPGGGIAAIAEGMACFFPAVMAASWLLMSVINGMIAQGLLTRYGRQVRPSPSVGEIEMPEWLGTALALAVGIAVLGSPMVAFVGLNTALILTVPFFFAGLAVVHLFARRYSARSALLTGFYVVTVLFGWPVLVVVILGIVERWVRLRDRLGPAA